MSEQIRSSKQALRESMALNRIWSNETYLTQRILIYCAELLEQIAKRKARKQTAWQKFLSREMKRGKTVKEAAALWKERKT